MAHLARALVRQAPPLASVTIKTFDFHLRRSLKQSKIVLLSAAQKKEKHQDRIVTVPNLLCVGRIAVSPYLATTIINGDLNIALAIFGLAGFSDLVRLFCQVEL